MISPFIVYDADGYLPVALKGMLICAHAKTALLKHWLQGVLWVRVVPVSRSESITPYMLSAILTCCEVWEEVMLCGISDRCFLFALANLGSRSIHRMLHLFNRLHFYIFALSHSHI
jgi:hypothetical protein